MDESDPVIVAALREQLAERQRLLDAGAARVGWKVALGIDEVADRPVMGYLTSATQLAPGGRHSTAGARELAVDAEVAVRVGGGFAAALEVVDLAQGRGSVASVLRANVLHRAVVLGPARADSPREGRIYVGGELRARGDVDFDPAERVEIVRYWLAALGEPLQAADWVITASIVQVQVAPGDEVAVELEGLGRLDLTIVP